jgi:membrane protease YdiL (CAAX protease family)
MISWILVAAIPFSISASRLDLDLKDYLVKPKISLSKLISLTCVGVGIMLAVTAIPSLFYMLVRTQSAPYEFVGIFTTKNNILKNVVYFILMVLVQPVCDEIIFRGIIQRQLGHYGRYFGVLASALLYMISRPTLTEALPGFFLGWYLALVTLRYHSIRPAIQIHIFISFFTWLINITPQSLVLIPTVMIIIIYIIAGFSLFNGTVNLGIARSGASNGKLWKILLTSPTIIICMVLFLTGVILSFTAL